MESIKEKKQCFIFYGFKASGKTTHAKRFAKNMGYQYIDLDQHLLETYQKNSISKLYKEIKTSFRDVEFEQFIKLLHSLIETNENTVLSLGGGTLLHPKIDHVYLKKYFTLIFIDTHFDIIYKRIQQQETIYKSYSYEKLKKLYLERTEFFRHY